MEVNSANPARPEDREELDLPTKSYAEAVEEEIPAIEKEVPAIETPSTPKKGENRYLSNAFDDLNVKTTTNGKTVSVLNIVNTNGDKHEETNKRPDMERQESKREYSAVVRCQVSSFCATMG